MLLGEQYVELLVAIEETDRLPMLDALATAGNVRLPALAELEVARDVHDFARDGRCLSTREHLLIGFCRSCFVGSRRPPRRIWRANVDVDRRRSGGGLRSIGFGEPTVERVAVVRGGDAYGDRQSDEQHHRDNSCAHDLLLEKGRWRTLEQENILTRDVGVGGCPIHQFLGPKSERRINPW